jgi:hypothetical protein
VVVVVGLTLVEPLAEADVKLPGLMLMLVVPVDTQVSVELDPDEMLAGLAVNEVMTGTLDPDRVTVAVAVTEPEELVAVSV